MAIILALTPQNGYFGTQLTAGNTWVDVSWETQLTAADDVANAVPAIDAAIHDPRWAGEDLILYGHSMASEGIQAFLRLKGLTCDIPPSRMRIILAANPENAYTGITQVPTPPSAQPVYVGGKGFPANIQFPVLDISREYDMFAGWPNAVAPTSAAINNIWAMGGAVHLDYFNVSLDPNDPSNTSWVVGNTTYVVSYVALGDEALRPEIELGYNRPVPIRTPA